MEHARIVGDIKLWVIYEDEAKKDLELKISLDELISADVPKTWEFKVDLPGYYDVLQKVSENTFVKRKLHYTTSGNLHTGSPIRLTLDTHILRTHNLNTLDNWM
jgi:hypothetical protein